MQNTFTLDLHTHRNEMKVPPREYWGQAERIGIDAIAITEHAHISPREAFEALYPLTPEQKVLIPGAELNTMHGHVLVYAKTPELYEVKELFQKDVSIEKVLEIAKENGFLLTIPHPWGFNYDSFGYNMGIEKLEQLVMGNEIGVEAYNGMIGHLSNFVYGSGIVKKPVNFLDFLEKNRIAIKTRVSGIGSRLKKKIDDKRLDIVERCSKALDLGEKASFITAGSDAHSAKRIGLGILKIKSDETKLTIDNVFEILRQKENVVWSGPLVKEISPGEYRKVNEPWKARELLQGIRYSASSVIRRSGKRIGRKIRKKIGGSSIKKKIGNLVSK